MKEEQVDRLLEELAKTRESFDVAARSIKWSRRNTIIQYGLIFVVVCMLLSLGLYYKNQQHAACVRGNDLRMSIATSLDNNAAAIGASLVIVTGASPEDFDAYMDAYSQQAKPEALKIRGC